MSVETQPTTRRKAPAGERRACAPAAVSVSPAQAQHLALLAKALADPVRVQLVDALGAAPELCPCELLPLFDISQPTLAHHLKVLRDAGVVGCRRQGLFAYYRLIHGGLDDLAAHLCQRETT
jgi:ArsR family transcriptional regulator